MNDLSHEEMRVFTFINDYYRQFGGAPSRAAIRDYLIEQFSFKVFKFHIVEFNDMA